MAVPTTGSATELSAVNQILASVGQAPVTTLDRTNPDVAIAYDCLLQTNQEVQAEGWTFNKEFDYIFNPDAEGNIRIPDNVLQLELSDNPQYGNQKIGHQAIRRDGRLYDRVQHTYYWAGPQYCDVVWWFDWLDLPIPIQNYIVAKSARIVSTRIVGDGQQQQFLAQDEAYTRSFAIQYETNQGDYSFFGYNRNGADYYSYQPFQALLRR